MTDGEFGVDLSQLQLSLLERNNWGSWSFAVCRHGSRGCMVVHDGGNMMDQLYKILYGPGLIK